MKRGCAILCLVCLCGCPCDPYNALIWNRANAARHSGVVDTGPWFEWWYYKLVLPESRDAFFFIYGVVNPWDETMENPSSRAYITVGNAAENEIIDAPYPVSEFSASYWATDIRVADQRATDKSIVGSLVDADGGQVSWDIQIEKRWRFNAMGWAMFVPEITNILWYPAQADALFTGWIDYKGEVYNFENAPAYQDRNWGRTFPEWWAWIVSNHFEGHPDTALTIGGGKPVILDVIDVIEGVAIGLVHEGREYAFRPNDGDCVRVNINYGTWEVEAINRAGYRIEVEAAAPCDSFTDIPFVTPQGEEFHDFETLTGEVTVRLYEQTGCAYPRWRLIEMLSSDFAGIEYGHRDLEVFDCFANQSKELYSNF